MSNQIHQTAGSTPGGKTHVTLDDLRTGRRARINEIELEQLGIRRRRSAQRDRWKGKGIPFYRDQNGRIFYAAEDVLAYIDSPKHRSTNEYNTSAQLASLAAVRESKFCNQEQRVAEA